MFQAGDKFRSTMEHSEVKGIANPQRVVIPAGTVLQVGRKYGTASTVYRYTVKFGAFWFTFFEGMMEAVDES